MLKVFDSNNIAEAQVCTPQAEGEKERVFVCGGETSDLPKTREGVHPPPGDDHNKTSRGLSHFRDKAGKAQTLQRWENAFYRANVPLYTTGSSVKQHLPHSGGGIGIFTLRPQGTYPF